MKKSFTIFLILSFIFNAGGYLLIYVGSRYYLNKEATEKIKSGIFYSGYEIIAFSNLEMKKGISDLIFLSKREFSYRGKMFDIVQTSHKNDSTYFYCLPDKDEDKLNLAYNNSIDKSADNADKKSAAEKLTKNIITEALIPGLLTYLYKEIQNGFISFDKNFSPKNFPDIAAPPPNSSIS